MSVDEAVVFYAECLYCGKFNLIWKTRVELEDHGIDKCQVCGDKRHRIHKLEDKLDYYK